MNDDINHPKHYTAHPSGVECIDIVEHLSFNLGNAVKYIWRAGLKSPDADKDLEKARWYICREIVRIGIGKATHPEELVSAGASTEDRARPVTVLASRGYVEGGRR